MADTAISALWRTLTGPSFSKLSCDLRAVHCRSKLGRPPGDFTGIYRYFAIVGCAVDGAKRGLLETLAHVHQLTVKASVIRTHTGGFAHKVVDGDVSDLVVLEPHRFLGCDVVDIGEGRVNALLGSWLLSRPQACGR